MNLLTVARRATLGANIRKILLDARTRLGSGRSCATAIVKAEILKPSEHEFFESTYITGLVATVEAALGDSATEFLTCYPGYLSDKTVTLADLNKSGSVADTIAALAEKNVNDWSYRRFSEFIELVLGLFDSKATLALDLVISVSEIKATRDLLVHANGIVNNIYLQKAGSAARAAKVGVKIALGDAYLAHAEHILDRLLTDFEAAIPERIKNMGRASAFKEMWNATCLARLVPFESAWRIASNDMVRPCPPLLDWSWSHSEKMLVDFFLGIYAEHHEAREYDLMEALRRWSPASNEGKIMASWSNAPFWF